MRPRRLLVCLLLAVLSLGPASWGSELPEATPEDELVVVVLQQYMPYSMLLDQTLKPLIYNAIVK